MNLTGSVNWTRVVTIVVLTSFIGWCLAAIFVPGVPGPRRLIPTGSSIPPMNIQPPRESEMLTSTRGLLGLLLFSLALGLVWAGRLRYILMAFMAMLASAALLPPALTVSCLYVALFSLVPAAVHLGLHGRATPGGLLTTAKVVAIAFAAVGTVTIPLSRIPIPLGPSAYTIPVLFLALLYLRVKLVPHTLRDPQPLPAYSIRSRVRGVTLIELLIVVAIIAIIVPLFLKANMIAMQHSRRAAEARQATMQVRSELDRMRAGAVVLEPGVYTRAGDEAGIPMVVEIAAPRADGVTSVTLRMTIGRPLMPQTLAFEALILGGES